MIQRAVRHYLPRPWRAGTHRRAGRFRWSRDTVGLAVLGAVSVLVVGILLAVTPNRVPEAVPDLGAAVTASSTAGADAQRAERDRSTVPTFTRWHVVREGDSLWTIARDDLGDGAKWQLVGWINHKDAGDPLRLGERIKLP